MSRAKESRRDDSEDRGVNCRSTHCRSDPDPLTGKYVLHITKTLVPKTFNRNIRELTFVYQVQNTTNHFFEDNIVLVDTALGIEDLGYLVLAPHKFITFERKYQLSNEEQVRNVLPSNAYIAKRVDDSSNDDLRDSSLSSSNQPNIAVIAAGPRTSNVASASASSSPPLLYLTAQLTNSQGNSNGFITTSNNNGYVIDPATNLVYMSITVQNPGTISLGDVQVQFNTVPKGYASAQDFVNVVTIQEGTGQFHVVNNLPVLTFSGLVAPDTSENIILAFPLYMTGGPGGPVTFETPWVLQNPWDNITPVPMYQDSWTLSIIGNANISVKFSPNIYADWVNVRAPPNAALPITFSVYPVYDSTLVLTSAVQTSTTTAGVEFGIMSGTYYFGYVDNNGNFGKITSSIPRNNVINIPQSS